MRAPAPDKYVQYLSANLELEGSVYVTARDTDGNDITVQMSREEFRKFCEDGLKS
jgi:hypothetical protein